jgi:hypothetical protein
MTWVQRLLVLLVVSGTAILAHGTGVAFADSVFLGQVGKLGVSASCGDCSAVQFADTGPATGIPESGGYTAPSSGVLTYFGYRAGAEITTSPADSVRPQVFSVVGNTALVNHQGAAHVIQPWPGAPPPSGGTRYFRDRVPVSAGEVLGGRFLVKSIAINGDPTPAVFPTAAGGDKIGVGLPGSSLGGSFTATPESSLRVNLLATLEPDADQDGYGDISQDLCLGSPIGEGACSGALSGSRLQSEVLPGGSCSGECLLLQKTIGGASQAAPFDDVVVRWRVLDADTGSYSVRTVAPQPNEFYRVGPSSAVGNVVASSPIRPMKKAITSFPTRIPIEAGGYVGLVDQASVHRQQGPESSGTTYQQLANAVPDGTVERGLISPPAGELLYDADIEPDADHDGYGDITQDSCPGTATVHDGQCPVIDVFPPPATPKVTGLEVVPNKFRVKPKGASAKLKLTLSREATVAFGIEAKKACGGKKGKGRKARCKPGFHAVQTIAEKLPAGQNAVPYGARLRRGSSEAPLRPGSYRVTAVPTTGGVTGKAARATFKVLPPRHRAGH